MGQGTPNIERRTPTVELSSEFNVLCQSGSDRSAFGVRRFVDLPQPVRSDFQ